MRIAIPVDEKNIDSNVCMSFGRAPYYLIFDTDTDESEFVVNTAATSAGGAGIRAAQIVADQKVDVLLTPRCGQNAAEVIQAANIKLYKTSGTSIKDNIDAMKAGTLSPLDEIHAGLHGH
ncbi:MAG: dinitrogenase iron-molybdenum cofactor biosynthesis protein [Clostridiaceae bacterium]|jgi:predicted Fe-Mo cluster-binding NifX family protein|nr:dinitrogenase iron-molybdenum cofactor biosynthesis protein [Clostridiaceae bacterium]